MLQMMWAARHSEVVVANGHCAMVAAVGNWMAVDAPAEVVEVAVAASEAAGAGAH